MSSSTSSVDLTTQRRVEAAIKQSHADHVTKTGRDIAIIGALASVYAFAWKPDLPAALLLLARAGLPLGCMSYCLCLFVATRMRNAALKSIADLPVEG